MKSLAFDSISPLLAAAHGDGYEWGWDTWVAIGTLALALMTGFLAIKTRAVAVATNGVARETRELALKTTELASRTAEDVAAQFRPILVPDKDEGMDRSIDYGDEFLTLRLRNAGQGPALSMRVFDLVSGVEVTEWDRGALAPDLVVSVIFSHYSFPMSGEESQIGISYKDLSGEVFQTTVSIYGEPQFGDAVYYVIRNVTVERSSP